jgi:FkbM family methyltransferase
MLLQHLLAPGMTFVDVGANWGYFTLVAGHLVGPQGRIVSVEADLRACRVIRENLARNRLASVTVIEAAAGDRPGTIELQTYGEGSDESGNFGLAASTTVVPGGARFEVSVRPLDDVLDEAGIDRVDVLKMDIEGAEARALPGLARRLSARRIDRLILELHPRHLKDQGQSAATLVALMRGHGYHGWRIDHRPETHRRAAAGSIDVSSFVSPLDGGVDCDDWPHLLWTKDEQPWTT